MRKKQVASKSSHLDEFFFSDGKLNGSVDGSYSSELNLPKPPTYFFDENGNATLLDGTPVVEPVPVELQQRAERKRARGSSARHASRFFHPGVLDVVKCTVCATKLHLGGCTLKVHPTLKVIVCKRCKNFYTQQTFLKDVAGKDENCRWCGDGGDLICCDTCSNAFCKRCIKRNLGRSVLHSFESLDDSEQWHCFVCDPTPIESLQSQCSQIMSELAEFEAVCKQRQEASRTRLFPTGKASSALRNSVGLEKASSSNSVYQVIPSPIVADSISSPHLFQNLSETPAPSALRDLLQLLGQTLGSPLGSYAAEKPTNGSSFARTDIPIGHPVDQQSILRSVQPNKGTITSTDAVTTPAVFRGLSSNFDASVILNQINTVTGSNVHTAIKATRRCIDLFSSDLRLLEEKLSKASSVTEIASIVRSFHSIYRFHFFARFANLAHRMREELPHELQGEFSLDAAERTSGPFTTHSSSAPFTIDLTDDDPVRSDGLTLAPKDSPHKQIKSHLKDSGTHNVGVLEHAGISTMSQDNSIEPHSFPAANIQLKNGPFSTIDPKNILGGCPSPPAKRICAEMMIDTDSTDPIVTFPERLVTGSTSRNSMVNQVVHPDTSFAVVSLNGQGIDTESRIATPSDFSEHHSRPPDVLWNCAQSQPIDSFDIGRRTNASTGNEAPRSISIGGKTSDQSSYCSTGINDVDTTIETSTLPIPLQESTVCLEDIRPRIGDKSVVLLSESFQQDSETLGTPSDTKPIGETLSRVAPTLGSSDNEIESFSSQVSSLERACDILEKRVNQNNGIVVPQSFKNHTIKNAKLHPRNNIRKRPHRSSDQSIQPLDDEGLSVDKTGTDEEDDNDFSFRSALLAEADADFCSNVNYRDELLRSSSDEAEHKVNNSTDNETSNGSCVPPCSHVSTHPISGRCARTLTSRKHHCVPEKHMGQLFSPKTYTELTEDCVKLGNSRLSGEGDIICADDKIDGTLDSKPDHNSFENVNRKVSGSQNPFDPSSSSAESNNHKNSSTARRHKSEMRTSLRSSSDSSFSNDSVNHVRFRSREIGECSVSDPDAVNSTQSESENRKMRTNSRATNRRRRKPHRRRIVASGSSSGDDNGPKPKGSISSFSCHSSGDNESGNNDDDHKGRRDIRKILKQSNLSEQTKSAEAEERERRRRIAERQQRYNEVVVQEGSGVDVVTTKLVLEISSDNSAPIVQVHRDIVKHLKPHQVDAVRFLWDCVIESVARQQTSSDKHSGGAILAHCMGLGKTLSLIAFVHTVIAHRDLLGISRCLVICPVNTLLNWKQELEMWLPEDDYLDVFELASKGDFKHRIDVLDHWFREGGVLLIGYDMFRNFVGTQSRKMRNKLIKETINRVLVDPGPDIVVCDEGHVLKNVKSGLSKAVSQIRTLKRIVLTGTPLQNNLSEYHAMVSFVKPNLLGTAREFSNRFVNPIRNGQHSNSTDYDVCLMKKRAHVLYKTLDGCIQRKDYNALTKYLPPRYEYVIMCRLSQVQRDFYESYLQFRGHRLCTGIQSLGGEAVVDRSKSLFSDQQTLYRIWTHPHLLRSHETREARKMLLEDDDVLTCTSEELGASDDSETVEETSSSESVSTDLEPSSKSIATTRRVPTFSRTTRSSRTKLDDVIILESDCSDSQRDDADPSEPKDPLHPWWYRLYKEEYDWSVEVGCKLEVLLHILKKCNDIGDKMLIFTQSLLSLDLLERFLGEMHRQWLIHQDEANHQSPESGSCARPDLSAYFSDIGENTWIRGFDYERLDGSMNAVVRKQIQHRFNHPANTRLRLFLISTRAGGLGINLIAANRLILFDASWNPSHDIQSIFRSYRFGQTKPAYIYRLIAQGTMEEKIYDRQVTKQSLSLRVIDEQQVGRHFSDADLQALFVFDPDIWTPGDTERRPTPKLPKDRLLADILSEFPHLIVSYHEHDSLLEHREDEGLSEIERQEAWREYEDEKKYGMPLAQYQRLLQQQEMAAHNQQHLALNWRLFQQQQQQLLVQQHLQQQYPWRMSSGPPLFGRALRAPSPLAPQLPRAPIGPSAQTRISSVPSSLSQMFEKYRAHLLRTRPNLVSDPARLEKMVVSQMMGVMTKNVRTTLPVPMPHFSSPSTSQSRPSST